MRLAFDSLAPISIVSHDPLNADTAFGLYNDLLTAVRALPVLAKDSLVPAYFGPRFDIVSHIYSEEPVLYEYKTAEAAAVKLHTWFAIDVPRSIENGRNGYIVTHGGVGVVKLASFYYGTHAMRRMGAVKAGQNESWDAILEAYHRMKPTARRGKYGKINATRALYAAVSAGDAARVAECLVDVHEMNRILRLDCHGRMGHFGCIRRDGRTPSLTASGEAAKMERPAADLEWHNPKDHGFTALQKASSDGQHEIVALLIAAGSKTEASLI